MNTVDIIIPTRNRFRLTLEAVESVRRQSFAEWHLWIMDDASDDGSLDGLRKTFASDDRITVVANEKAGPVRLRQRALELGGAQWVALLDSDDLWLPDKLEKQLAAAGDADLVLCWYEWFRPDGSTRKTGQIVVQENASPLLTNNMSIPLIRRSWLNQVGGLGEQEGLGPILTCDNTELYLRLVPQAKISVVNEVLTRCRDHSGPRSSDASSMRLGAEEMARVVFHHEGLLERWPRESADLLAQTAARYVSAGDRIAGYGYFGRALRCAPYAHRVKILRRFGAFLAADVARSLLISSRQLRKPRG